MAEQEQMHSTWSGGAAARIFVALAVVAALAVTVASPAAPTPSDPASPAAAEASTTAVAVTQGSAHTCVRMADGSVRCWGEGSLLGQGHGEIRGDDPGEMGAALPAVDLGTGRTATEVDAGGGSTCAILDNGTVKCWGEANGGVLGGGEIVDAVVGDAAGEMGDDLFTVDLGANRTAVAISVGAAHACAILDDDTLKCWGRNNRGQLGLGDSSNRGDAAGEMGDDLPAVDLGAGRTAVAISSGGDNTCAVLDDETLKCWGFGAFGQLGLGEGAIQDNQMHNRGDAPNQMGDNLPAIDLGSGGAVTDVTAMGANTCALRASGAVQCWGWNAQGDLGSASGQAAIGDQPNEMGANLAVINLGTGRTATDLGDMPCATLDSGVLKCWGTNTAGRLGLGDTRARGLFVTDMGDNLPAVDLGTGRTVAALASSCAVFVDGEVKCWGTNSSGQLGVGDTRSRGDNPNEMGDSLPVADLRIGAAFEVPDGNVTVVAPEGAVIEQASLIDLATLPPIPEGLTASVALSFDVGVATGATADVEIGLPPGTDPTGYLKIVEGEWVDFAGNFDIDGDVIILHLQDGGAGDSDGTADGTIHDPGTPVIPPETPTTPTFGDVPLTHPFFVDIEWMNSEEITTGYPGGLYKPAAAVTRAAMSAFMFRLAGSPLFENPPTATFSDVGTTSLFFTQIEWMNSEDITTGYPGGLYKPAAAVTRAAMSAFMHRLADGPGVAI